MKKQYDKIDKKNSILLSRSKLFIIIVYLNDPSKANHS